MQEENILKTKIDTLANNEAKDITDSIAAHPDDTSDHQQKLYDLKFVTVKNAADLAASSSKDFFYVSEETIWQMGQNLPDFNSDILYQKRSSLIAIGAAVFLGWLLGGILSGILNFISLGGDIIRALSIFVVIWIEEYLGTNPRARKIMLTVLGLGALTRFAVMLAAGMIRFTNFSGIRQLIFGTAGRTNIFKSAWLIFGAFFLFIFFAKKITGLDLTAFRENLREQIIQRLNFCVLIFQQIDKSEGALRNIEKKLHQSPSSLCPKNDCQLALGAISILDSLDPDKRAYLSDLLNSTGYKLQSDGEYLIWNEDEHSANYESIGLVKNGERCRILKHPYIKDGKIIKGHVQRID